MIISEKKYEPETLHRLWKAEIEILDVVSDFCKQHQIKYSLAYGTLLGAVRHKGYIPWDDDIDIMMLRDDYNKFKRLWLENPVDGYVLEDDSIFDDFHENFMKIRKRGTTFIQFESEFEPSNLIYGIFIDIFAFDRAAPEGVARKKQYYANMVNMLYSRNYPSEKKGIIGVGEKLLLAFPVSFKRRMKQRTRRYLERWNNHSEYPLIDFCTLDNSRLLFPDDMFDNIVELDFEGKKYCSVSKFETALRISFGDYMQLPPENQRASHYPLLLDFEREYCSKEKRKNE